VRARRADRSLKTRAAQRAFGRCASSRNNKKQLDKNCKPAV
jgi:hypothetical protein